MYCTMYCTAKVHKKTTPATGHSIFKCVVWCGVLTRPAFFLKNVCCSNYYLGIHFPLPNSPHSLFNNHFTSAIGYELAIIITYPTSEWNNCFTKNAHKVSRILPDFICKNNRFSACF